MAQDLVRSSLDGENPPAAEEDADFPSPFHRTNWFSQHRAKCWEVVKRRGCLIWAVLRGEARVGPGGLGGGVPGGSRVNWERTVTLNQFCWECPPKPHPTGMEGRKGDRETDRKETGRKDRQSQVRCVTAAGERWVQEQAQSTPWSQRPQRPKSPLETKLKDCSFLPHCSGDRKGLYYSHHLAVGLAPSMRACLLSPLSKHWPSSDSVNYFIQRMKQVMRTMPLRLRH